MPIPARLQDLPPNHARLCLKVRDVLTDIPDIASAAPGPHRLCVAFSGGTDSTALLLILRCLAPSMNLRLYAVHLDHALRPESAAEADRCATFCTGLGIPFLVRRTDVAAFAATHGLGIEEAARACRQAWFAKTLEQLGAMYTVLGHQLNDLAEDILMRLIRGAGWPALGGMSDRDDSRRILRPLLHIPRADLALFLADCGIRPLDDPSNADRRYTRNRVRHDILPLLLQENPAFLEHAASLHRAAALDAELFRSLAPATAEHIPHALLRDLPKALRLRLYKSCLDALGPGQAIADSLENLDDLYLRKRTGALIQFPGGKTAQIMGTTIAFKAGNRAAAHAPSSSGLQ